jgi:SAM-dependent methyltransferase
MLGPLRRIARRAATKLSWAISAVLPYAQMVADKQALDKQYASGEWDYLRNMDELPRFSIVAGYCTFLKPSARILELGCGDGALPDRIGRGRYRQFLGVDISAEAIRRAARNEDESTKFLCRDARCYAPEQEFDIIVFNEVLEYFEDPAGTVRRYERLLAVDGFFVVSMFRGIETARTTHIWRRLDTRYKAQAQSIIYTKRDHSWVIKVYPRPAMREPGSIPS